LYQPNGCGFWKWEDAYIDYLRARWGHIFNLPAPLQLQQQHPAMVQAQADIRNLMFIGMATLIGVLLLLGAKI
jgi:hypothetical protein